MLVKFLTAHCDPQIFHMLGLNLVFWYFSVYALVKKGFLKQIVTQVRIPFQERLRGSVLKPTLLSLNLLLVALFHGLK